MASIKVSELPAVTSITPNDVLIINDENAVTSSITITFFTSSFTGQDLEFSGLTNFIAPVTFGANALPTFNADTVFNQRATFNGPITLGALADIPLGDLSDVTIPAFVPDGNVLAWDETVNSWVPEPTGLLNALIEDPTPQLGGDLDVNGYAIVSDAAVDGPNGKNIILDPADDGIVIIRGYEEGQVDGSITLNCYKNTHGVRIQSPPHETASTYTLLLPNNMGTAGQVLSTNGTSATSWITITPQMINAATAAQGTTADSALQAFSANTLANAADDNAAASAGVPVNGIYRNGNDLKVRLA